MRQNPFHRLHQLWKLHWKDLLDETQSIQRHLKRLGSFFQSETKSGHNSDQGRFKWMTAYINWREKSDPKGVDYTGNVAQTKSHPRFGIRPCRPWSEMFGKKMPEDGKYNNFCRNPGGSQRAPFCWVKEGFPGPKFGFCDVPDCVSRHEHRFISNQFRSRPLLQWTCKWSL